MERIKKKNHAPKEAYFIIFYQYLKEKPPCIKKGGQSVILQIFKAPKKGLAGLFLRKYRKI
jgi:hypothetical protein